MPVARVGGEVGQLGQRQVDLHDAAAGLPVLDVGDEVVGQLGARNLVEERDLRVQRGDHQRRVDLLAVLEDRAVHPAAADDEPRDPCVGADLGAEAAGRPGDRLGDRAHAAFGVAPAAELAVADVADRVVRHHVGGAGLVRAGPGADHAVDRERAFDLR